MTHPLRSSSEPELGVSVSQRESEGRTPAGTLQARFIEQLALHSDGIGWVQTLECLRRRGVLERVAKAGSLGIRLSHVAEASGANLGYLSVVFRVLAAQGWLWRDARRGAEHTYVGLNAAGHDLYALLGNGEASGEVTAFLPIASDMAAYLAGTFDPPPHVPALRALVRKSVCGWGLPLEHGRRQRVVTQRLAAALDGNLLGPVAVELHRRLSLEQPAERERPGYLAVSEARRFEPEGDRLKAAFDVLVTAGWAEWAGSQVALTEFGTYAMRRALAFGVPVSYLPLFGRIDELLFGDAERVWHRQAGEPENLVDRAMNVRSSGASHGRYFAAADEIMLRAFDLPWPEQPLGFCDTGCGDGSWLEHTWNLILNRTERGRLMRAFPQDERYQPLLVGADYNEAARSATRERLTRAGVPHLVLFGDINDPASLRRELAQRGTDSRDLLHGNSFLVHNRPYAGVKDRAAAARRRSKSTGTYAWRGQAVANADLEQNLVEFFEAWHDVIGRHGMVVIELHDPELVVVGRTLTNYILTHGLSDQLTVGVDDFLRAAAEAGLVADPAQQRFYPEPRDTATISVSHFRGAKGPHIERT
jgi:hypothetical protein